MMHHLNTQTDKQTNELTEPTYNRQYERTHENTNQRTNNINQPPTMFSVKRPPCALVMPLTIAILACT